MATYLLDSDRAVGLPAVPLRVTAEVSGGVPAVVELRAPAGSGTTAHTAQPLLMMLTKVGEPGTIVVRSATGLPFPEGTTASIEVAAKARQGDGEGEFALLQSVRVGGLTERALLTVRRSGARIAVHAITSSEDEVDLGRVGDAARAVVLSLLGVSVLEESRTVPVSIGIDASASFRRRVRDGSVAVALDLLSAVASVVGHGRPIAAAVLGSAATSVPVDGPATIRNVLEPLLASPRSTGSSASGFSLPAGAVFVLTDDPAAVHQPPDGVHWVVLEPESVLLASRAVPGDVTVLDPATQGGLAEALLRDQALLRTTMTSLLADRLAVKGTTTA